MTAQQSEAPGGAPRVQVLLSAHNGARFLREQLDSILAQDWPALSLKVRDDGSSDDTRAILSEYQAAGRLQAEFGPHLGALQSFALLLDSADGQADYFAFSDQDDVWLPGKIRRAVHCLEAAAAEDRGEESGELPLLYGCRSTITDAALHPLGLTPLPRRGPSFANALVESILHGGTLLMNQMARAKIASRGIPREALAHDWWCYLVISATGRVIYDPSPQRLYRQHSGNLTGEPAKARARFARKLSTMLRLRTKAGQRLLSQAQAFQARFGAGLASADHLRLTRICDAVTPGAALRFILGRNFQRQSRIDSLGIALAILAFSIWNAPTIWKRWLLPTQEDIHLLPYAFINHFPRTRDLLRRLAARFPRAARSARRLLKMLWPFPLGLLWLPMSLILRVNNPAPRISEKASNQTNLAQSIETSHGEQAARSTIGLMKRFGLPFSMKWDPLPSPSPQTLSQFVWELREKAIELALGETPEISIIIPVHNQIAYTIGCITSVLNSKTRYAIEIIVADDASSDETQSVFSNRIPGLQYLRNNRNLGFLRNCNAAAENARGRALVFLNNDTVVLPGWLDELIGTLEGDSRIGIVGSKLLYPDGRLQESGCIIWRDGSGWQYGHRGDPQRSEYNYMRDVDYCSGASLAISRALWDELGGFDTYYDVAYYEDTDLYFRIRSRGLRSVVQPLSALIHFEGVSSGRDVTQADSTKSYQLENHQRFHSRWMETLQDHEENPGFSDPKVISRAANRGVEYHVLIADDDPFTVNEHAGGVNIFEMMIAFRELGFRVTFLNWWGSQFEDGMNYLRQHGIEVYPSSSSQFINRLYATRQFDLLIFVRYPIVPRWIETFRKAWPKSKALLKLADLHFLRVEREAEVKNSESLRIKAKEMEKVELKSIEDVDASIMHSHHEFNLLLQRGFSEKKLHVSPLIIEPMGLQADFESRQNIMFIGFFNHPPNADALTYFISDVWPHIHRELPQIKFQVVGSHMSKDILSLDGRDGIEVLGYVEDLDQALASVRMTVAPLRYGAGTKGKVAMSLSRGVPCVLTSIAAEGMGFGDGEVIVADDPLEMAQSVVRVYRDRELWYALSRAGLAYIEANSSRRSTQKNLIELFEKVGLPWPPRRPGIPS